MVPPNLPMDIHLLIAEYLGPKDWISMITAHNFDVSLLEEGAALSNQDDDGNTVLHYLAAGGSIQLLCLLLEKAVDVTIRNKKNETALLCAVHEGRGIVVRELLKAGADPNTSITPGPEDEARRLLRAKISVNNTRRAHGKVLRKRGFNVDRYGEQFKKALHFAAEKGNGSIVELLLNAGADVSCTTFLNRSALHYAAIGGHDSVFDQLLGARIDPDIMDYFGMTASNLASTDLVFSNNQWSRVEPAAGVSPLPTSSLSAVLADFLRNAGVLPSVRIVHDFRCGLLKSRKRVRSSSSGETGTDSSPLRAAQEEGADTGRPPKSAQITECRRSHGGGLPSQACAE
ncbi:hypothetical protein OEA41_008709 [Lepraria neglecta]|uniref:Ankyrin n=1 Tax=Lepraria neglecta TaxID=209136 RepID=A0AAD9Z1Z4_9LECA|nr:hypothetical protein OEA41_008709 [Lepraria neglecta]